FDEAIEIVSDVRIPEPDHAPAIGFQRCRAPCICTAIRMLGAVDLDNQSRPAAGEVCDERAKPKLASEARPNAGQLPPHCFLGGSRLLRSARAKRRRRCASDVMAGG